MASQSTLSDNVTILNAFHIELVCVPIKKVIVILSYLTCANHYT